MIVCKQCGHHNEDNDTFCGSCGKFLEWTGERVAVAEPEPEPEPVAAPEPEPAHHGLIDRVRQAVGLDESAAQPQHESAAPPPAISVPTAAAAAPAGPSAAPSATPTAPLRPIPVSSAFAPAKTPEPVLAGVDNRAAAPPTPAPTVDNEPLSRRPTSVAPALTRPRPGPRTVEQPTRRRPGDLICGQCGEGNDPARHFCRRCGSELAEAIAVQLPWYRRFMNRLFPSRQREAGWRPTRVGRPNVTGVFVRVLRLVIAALLVVGVLAFVLVPPFHNLVVKRVTAAATTIRKAVHPNLDPVHAVGANATTSTPGHLPGLAIDTFNNTYWAASASDKGPILVLRFASPVDLSEIGVTSGASGTGPLDQFTVQPRPHLVHLVFNNGYTTDVTLSDSNKAQFNPIEAKQVTSVEIHVMSSYAPAGASPSSVAITEVEFRTKD